VNSVINGIGTLASVFSLFKSNEVTLAPMKSQGFRKNINRGGMFMTGLLSICLLVLAPVMGAQRVLKTFDPLISLLKNLPYATWLTSWIKRWWDGDVDFDDLPQDQDELRSQLKELDGDETILDELDDLAETRDKLAEKTSLLDKKQQLKWRKEAHWQINVNVDGNGYVIHNIKKKSTQPCDYLTLVPLMKVAWKLDKGPIIFEPCVFKTFNDFKTGIEGRLSDEDTPDEKESSGDTDDDDGDTGTGVNLPNPYGAKILEKEAKRKSELTQVTKTLVDPDREVAIARKLAEDAVKEEDDVEGYSSASDGDLENSEDERAWREALVRAETRPAMEAATMTTADRMKKRADAQKTVDKMQTLIRDGLRGSTASTTANPVTVPTKTWISQERAKARAVAEMHAANANAVDTPVLAVSSKPIGPNTHLKPQMNEGDTATVRFPRLSWMHRAYFNDMVAQNIWNNYAGTLSTQWNAIKIAYRNGMLGRHLMHHLRWFWRAHKRIAVGTGLLTVGTVMYLTGCYKVLSITAENRRAAAKAAHEKAAARGKLPKTTESVELVPLKAKPRHLRPQKKPRGEKPRGRRGRAGQKGNFFQNSGKAEVKPATGNVDHREFDEYDDTEIGDYLGNDDDYAGGYGETFTEEQEEAFQLRDRYQPNDRYQEKVDRYGSEYAESRFYRDGKSRSSGVRMHEQAVTLPSMQDDSALRRAIYNSKHRKITCSSEELVEFVQIAQKAYAEQMAMPLKKQAWSPSRLSAGVYKVYCGDTYLCTGTLVSGKLFVVVHSLSEDTTKEYKAVNHVNTHKMFGKDIVLVNNEIAYFPINGMASPFKAHHMHVMKNAGIVTVFGFGNGSSDQPDSITGFASPLGWCNAPTRDGDCTSPVLNVDGLIVGFWTHGNGRDFGRFEPVTPEMKLKAAENRVTHVGLDFQLAPHSPQILL